MTDDLFEFGDAGHDYVGRNHHVRRPKEEADPNEFSPFGSVKPEGLPPVAANDGFGRAFDKGAPKKRPSKPREHYARVRTLLERELGGFFWTCDGFAAGAGGQLVSRDLLGFMDIQGLDGGGRLVGVNVTSKAAVAAHLRDYVDPGNTHGQARTPVESLLRRFLACGGRLLILGYEKQGPRWHYDRVEVTPVLLDEYKARKRGPRR